MTLQICNALTIFIFLINMVSMHGMEQNNNDLHPLLQLPAEVQQQIIFPCGIAMTEITEDNVDELNENIKVFFNFSRVCKYLHGMLKFPWIDVKLITKNSMMLDVLALMEQRSYEQYSIQDATELWSYKHPELVSFGYKKYRIIPLALVYSDACADVVKDERDRLEEKNYLKVECSLGCGRIAPYGETSCLSKAMLAQDIGAIKFLLDHGADIYQESLDEQGLAYCRRKKQCKCWYYMTRSTPTIRTHPICFHSPTIEVAQLFCEKADKQTLLSHSVSCAAYFELEHDYYTPDIMKFWFDYGIEAKKSGGKKSIIVDFIVGLKIDKRIAIDNFFKKAVLLLDKNPDQVNVKNYNSKETLLDLMKSDWCSSIASNDRESIIALLRQYGAKTSQELEVENTEQFIT